jgi:hypothetical protein
MRVLPVHSDEEEKKRKRLKSAVGGTGYILTEGIRQQLLRSLAKQDRLNSFGKTVNALCHVIAYSAPLPSKSKGPALKPASRRNTSDRYLHSRLPHTLTHFVSCLNFIYIAPSLCLAYIVYNFNIILPLPLTTNAGIGIPLQQLTSNYESSIVSDIHWPRYCCLSLPQHGGDRVENHPSLDCQIFFHAGIALRTHPFPYHLCLRSRSLPFRSY